MLEHFEKFDSCVADACAFLGIDRPRFFDLARQWKHYSATFNSFNSPLDFYTSWQDDMGRSNLCANIIDQFSRFDIASVVSQFGGNL